MASQRGKLEVSIHRRGKSKKSEKERLSVITESLEGRTNTADFAYVDLESRESEGQSDNFEQRVDGIDFGKCT